MIDIHPRFKLFAIAQMYASTPAGRKHIAMLAKAEEKEIKDRIKQELEGHAPLCAPLPLSSPVSCEHSES